MKYLKEAASFTLVSSFIIPLQRHRTANVVSWHHFLFETSRERLLPTFDSHGIYRRINKRWKLKL